MLKDFSQNTKIKVEAPSSDEHDIYKLEDELNHLKKALKERDDELFQLQIAHNTAKAVSVKLNTVLEQNKVNHETRNIWFLVLFHILSYGDSERWFPVLGDDVIPRKYII